MRFKTILAILCLAVLASCGNKEKSDDSDILLPEISLGTFEETTAKLSDIIGDHDMIPLETTDESLIGGRSNKVIKKDGYIFVQSINDVVMFDNTGHFVGKLSRIGRGPEEYESLLDFDIDASSDEIWVSSLKGIVKYKYPSLEFRGNIPLSFYANKFKCLSDGSFIAMTPDDKVFNVFSVDGKVTQSFFDKDLANSGQATVQFVEAGKQIASIIADTNTAVCYDPETGLFSMKEILSPGKEPAVTMDINREYFDKYGYMDFPSKVMEKYAGLIGFRTNGRQTIVALRYPGIYNSIIVDNGKSVKEYKVRPKEKSMINDNITGNEDTSFLLTFTACESDDSFLFLVNTDDESNPSILEVRKLK
ncbi:MAG: 6-bladed beta-propeller [Muribaculaceae bacterium]|nr:6-bladed beta-propeller [Muribaculaceae bacterium]